MGETELETDRQTDRQTDRVKESKFSTVRAVTYWLVWSFIGALTDRWLGGTQATGH